MDTVVFCCPDLRDWIAELDSIGALYGMNACPFCGHRQVIGTLGVRTVEGKVP